MNHESRNESIIHDSLNRTKNVQIQIKKHLQLTLGVNKLAITSYTVIIKKEKKKVKYATLI